MLFDIAKFFYKSVSLKSYSQESRHCGSRIGDAMLRRQRPRLAYQRKGCLTILTELLKKSVKRLKGYESITR